MACEATDRELVPQGGVGTDGEPLRLRRVDNRRCVSGEHKHAGAAVLQGFSFTEFTCSERNWKGRVMMQDESVMQIGLCVPLNHQSRGRGWGDFNKSFGEINIQRASSSQLSTAAAAVGDDDTDSDAHDDLARNILRRSVKQRKSAGSQAQQPRNSSLQLVRHCHDNGEGASKGSSNYDGQAMRCVRQYCPPETLGLLRLAACDLCDGKEPLIHFSQ